MDDLFLNCACQDCLEIDSGEDITNDIQFDWREHYIECDTCGETKPIEEFDLYDLTCDECYQEGRAVDLEM